MNKLRHSRIVKDAAIPTLAAHLSDHTPAAAKTPSDRPATPLPPLPAAVRNALDQAGLNHRPILLSVDTDVALDGRPAREWLVVTPDHLSVVPELPAAHATAGAAAGRPLRSVPWEGIDQVRTSAGMGGGTLQVRDGGDWVDLVRYSNAMATRFHKVS
ncbi:MAG: hypothetical protein NTY17_08285, partial [Planctomycetia bacterium]|nr:hypothetical protein [Planctomycetia bacterium]